jgi:hypothetical protein
LELSLGGAVGLGQEVTGQAYVCVRVHPCVYKVSVGGCVSVCASTRCATWKDSGEKVRRGRQGSGVVGPASGVGGAAGSRKGLEAGQSQNHSEVMSEPGRLRFPSFTLHLYDFCHLCIALLTIFTPSVLIVT